MYGKGHTLSTPELKHEVYFLKIKGEQGATVYDAHWVYIYIYYDIIHKRYKEKLKKFKKSHGGKI